jgi:prepilin-type N-terminal cleavage/methylation domain-containing protein
MPAPRQGFTLIELLVVVTIIVVLLALLTPALDKAIYQAELLTCAANQRATMTGVTTYAMGNKRFFPQRDALNSGSQYRRPNLVKAGMDADDMQRINSFLTWKMLFDPLNGGLTEDMIRDSLPTSNIYANYMLWWDWQFTSANGGAGSSKLGRPFVWKGTQFHVLISEEDMMQVDSRTHCSHQDAEGSQVMEVVIDGVVAPTTSPTTATETLSRWRRPGSARRGTIEANYGFQDGSVTRLDQVRWDDDRLERVTDKVDRGDDWPIYQQIPAR